MSSMRIGRVSVAAEAICVASATGAPVSRYARGEVEPGAESPTQPTQTGPVETPHLHGGGAREDAGPPHRVEGGAAGGSAVALLWLCCGSAEALLRLCFCYGFAAALLWAHVVVTPASLSLVNMCTCAV
jgi:hypothetical protein